MNKSTLPKGYKPVKFTTAKKDPFKGGIALAGQRLRINIVDIETTNPVVVIIYLRKKILSMAHSFFPEMPEPIVDAAGNKLVVIKGILDPNADHNRLRIYMAVEQAGTKGVYTFWHSLFCHYPDETLKISVIKMYMSGQNAEQFGDGNTERFIFPELFIFNSFLYPPFQKLQNEY